MSDRHSFVSPDHFHPDSYTTSQTAERILNAAIQNAEILEQQAGVRDVLYGYVGTEDYTLDPLIRPGAFVQIDPHQNKVTKATWPSEYDRPVYFVELRDNRYACSWCDYEGNHLLVVPSPKSPVAIRSFRYPQDAEIVGRVTGFAMLIAELRTDAKATPSQP